MKVHSGDKESFTIRAPAVKQNCHVLLKCRVINKKEMKNHSTTVATKEPKSKTKMNLHLHSPG